MHPKGTPNKEALFVLWLNEPWLAVGAGRIATEQRMEHAFTVDLFLGRRAFYIYVDNV
jgi:hypothetical protein